MNQLTQVLKEIDAIQQRKREKQKIIIKFLNINKLSHIFRLGEKYFYMLGIAIANCLENSSIFSITNKHRKMGEHSR